MNTTRPINVIAAKHINFDWLPRFHWVFHVFSFNSKTHCAVMKNFLTMNSPQRAKWLGLAYERRLQSAFQWQGIIRPVLSNALNCQWARFYLWEAGYSRKSADLR